MRRSLLALTPAVVLLALAPLQAQDLLLLRFGDYLDALRTQAGIPGLAAAIVGPEDILWEQAFGRQDVERAIATRTDTPFRVDGLTEIVTAALALRCVEEGTLSLDDPLSRFEADGADLGLIGDRSIRQILTHTSGDAARPVFTYAPEAVDRLGPALGACTGEPLRPAVAGLLDRLAMFDSVPGADAADLTPEGDDVPDAEAVARYGRVLERAATPYAVDRRGRATPAPHPAVPLTPAGGLLSTVRDLAQFIRALRDGVLVEPETLVASWQPPAGADGQRLPHAYGWFVHTHNGETVVWQFGMGDNASSSLVVMVPSRGLTLLLLANSSGLVRPFALQAGDLTSSPFGRVFLEMFVR